MHKSILFVIAAVALTLVVQSAQAQSDEKKFEVGGQAALLWVAIRTVTPSTITEDRTNALGFGGRFGYNFSSYIALEAETNFFPRDRDVEGGRKIQALFGVKAGKRFESVGVFAKARPGFIRYEKGDYIQPGGCPAVFPPPLGCFRPVARTNFALDLGGVLEFYPSKHTLVRFDAGDTIIRLGPRTVAAVQSPQVFASNLVAIPRPAETTHNFQTTVGFGFRF